MAKYLGLKFLADVLNVTLAGLSTATATVVTAADGILVAIGKLQAQLTPLTTRAGDVVNVKSFGATGNGTTDDTSALQSAWTYAQAHSLSIFIPAGIYILSAQLSWTVGAMSLTGAGIGLTVLSWTAAAATRGLSVSLDIDLHPCTIQGVTLQTFGTTGTAIVVDASPQVTGFGSIGVLNGGVTVNRTSPRFVFRDVNMRGGGNNPYNAYWDSGLICIAIIIGIVDSCTFEGGYTVNTNGSNYPYKPSVGFSFGDSTCKGQPTQYTVTNCTIMGAKIGILTTCVQGVHIECCDIVGVDNGVQFDDHYDTTGAQPHCAVINCHTNAVKTGVYVNNGSELLVQGCDIYRCSDDVPGVGPGYGIFIDGTFSTIAVIVGNNFSNSSATEGMTGVYFNNARNALVDCNTFRKYITTSAMNGITVNTGCVGIKVGESNHFTVDVGLATTFGATITDIGFKTIMEGAFVLLRSSTSQLITANTETALNWSTVQDWKCNNGLWSSGSPNIVTIAVDGLYRFTASVTWDTTGGGTRQLQFMVNASPFYGAGHVLGNGPVSGDFMIQNVTSAPIRLAAGNTISLSAKSSVAAFVLNNISTWMSVERLYDTF